VSTQTSTTPTTPTVRRLHCATLPYISIHPARLLARALLSFSFFSHASFLVSTTVLMSTTAQQQQWFGAMVAMVAAAIGFGSLDTLAELATGAPATAAPATAALATAAHHHGRHRRPMRRPRRRHGRHLRPRHRLPGHCRARHRRPPPHPPSPRPPPPPSPPPRPPPPPSPRQRRPRHRRPRRHCRPSPPPTTIASLEMLVQWLHLMAFCRRRCSLRAWDRLGWRGWAGSLLCVDPMTGQHVHVCAALSFGGV
jgi:hypothetical protein